MKKTKKEKKRLFVISVVIIIRCLIVHKPSTCISLVINTLIICNKKRKINILFENFSYPF